MAESINLIVKHAGSSFELYLPADATLAQLHDSVEELTGVLARKQKLICKGKTLSALAPTTPLQQAGIVAGSKLMLLAAAAAPSQGHAALHASQQARAAAVRQRRELQSTAPPPMAADAVQARAGMWRKTGIAALRDLKLANVPPELFSAAVAGGIRVLDLGGNRLTALPPALSSLTGLQKLRLSLNALTDSGVPWEAVAALRQLAVLALDSNQLTSLPDALFTLTGLQKLTLEHNRVAALPDTVGALASLRALSLRGNRLAALPPGLGACASLEEADFSGNPIASLPAELSRLTRLKMLLLDSTMVRSVPSALLTGASSLVTLSLHGCPVTVEQLRETAGWAEFDARRRAKYDKQVDMRVLLRNGGFDEGSDAVEWEHWRDA